jgi:hypothetical protein
MDIYGIDLHCEDFDIPVVGFDCKVEFDLISLFDSLEHFPDFAPVRKMRAQNVIVSIPNTPSILLSTPRSWRHFKPGEHLHYFSVTSLDIFMGSWGFPRKLVEGYPEDELRGKLSIRGGTMNNIYTAIYAVR